MRTSKVLALLALICLPLITTADNYGCVCLPGTKPWGCPFFPDATTTTYAPHACTQDIVPSPRPCGSRITNPCPNGALGPLVGSGKQINKDFYVDYNIDLGCPGCCTAFGIHSGGIDKGVAEILDRLIYCGSWGNYEFRGPDSTMHITETQFNEPCYELLRSIGSIHVHIHSFMNAPKAAICAGSGAPSTFIDALRTALRKRNKDVAVAKKREAGTHAQTPPAPPAATISMGQEAYHCGTEVPLSQSTFGAF